MIICNVFEGLGLNIEIRPVLDYGPDDKPKTRLVGRSFRPLVLTQAGRTNGYYIDQRYAVNVGYVSTACNQKSYATDRS